LDFNTHIHHVGIRPVGDVWSEQSRTVFEETVSGKVLFAIEKERKDSGGSSVMLLDTTTSPVDNVINHELVSLELAAKTTTD